MALSFPLELLSKEVKLNLKELLTFEPEVSYLADTYQNKAQNIKFFIRDDKQIKVPYMIGKVLKEGIKHKFPKYPKYKFSVTATLREHQIPVVQEATNILREDGSVILALHTGFGKTIVAIELARKLRGKTLILYTRLFLGTSWSNTLKKHTTCTTHMIMEKHNSLEKWLKDHDDIPDVLLVPVKRVDWISEEIRKKYKILIVDEAHELCTPKNAPQILKHEPRYVITLTATPNRQDGLFKMMETLSGRAIYRESKRKFYVHRILTEVEPEIVLNRKGHTDWNHLTNSLCENKRRNRLIVKLIQANQDKKVLFLSARKNHVLEISRLLTKKEIIHSTFYGKFKSYTDNMVVLGTFRK